MAGKDKGRSTVTTAEEQNAIRRAAKAKHKSHSGKSKRSSQQETLNEGLFHDRLAKRGQQMMDIVGVTMTSTGPATNTMLQRAAFVYVSEFTMNTERMPMKLRHEKALGAALREIEGQPSSLLGYAKAQLNKAYFHTAR